MSPPLLTLPLFFVLAAFCFHGHRSLHVSSFYLNVFSFSRVATIMDDLSLSQYKVTSEKSPKTHLKLIFFINQLLKLTQKRWSSFLLNFWVENIREELSLAETIFSFLFLFLHSTSPYIFSSFFHLSPIPVSNPPWPMSPRSTVFHPATVARSTRSEFFRVAPFIGWKKGQPYMAVCNSWGRRT